MGYAEKFRRYLVEDGKSHSTITSYVGDVEGFLCYLEYKGGQFDGQLRRFYVTSNKQHLADQGYKVNPINKIMNSQVCFNQYLVDHGVRESMVVNLKKDKIRIAYGSEQEEEVYTDGEVERLLFYIQDRSKVSVRDKLVILLLLYSGIRVGELVSIKLQDIDFLPMKLHIKGKGGKIREDPLRAELVEVAKDYQTTARKVQK